MGICVCKATRFEFNLNGYIKFKPTEYGKTIYKFHYIRNHNETNLEIDENGYAEMQLWEFMSIFGSFMKNGMDVPVETNVILINHTEEQIRAIRNKLNEKPDISKD